MGSSVESALFGEIRSAWPNRPYPLLVDHLDEDAGRVCPAASLYAIGKYFSDLLKAADAEVGEVAACYPRNWIEWVGMMQACLRRGVAFAPVEPGCRVAPAEWGAAVGASLHLHEEEVTRGPRGRRVGAGSIIVGPPAIEVTEAELLAVTEPGVVDPLLTAEDPVWLDTRMAPLAKAMAAITLLRAGVEVHVGLDRPHVLARADDSDRLFDGAGMSSTLAAVRARGAGETSSPLSFDR